VRRGDSLSNPQKRASCSGWIHDVSLFTHRGPVVYFHTICTSGAQTGESCTSVSLHAMHGARRRLSASPRTELAPANDNRIVMSGEGQQWELMTSGTANTQTWHTYEKSGWRRVGDGIAATHDESGTYPSDASGWSSCAAIVRSSSACKLELVLPHIAPLANCVAASVTSAKDRDVAPEGCCTRT